MVNAKPAARICKEHLGPVIKRKRDCRKCDKTFYLKKGTKKPPSLCPACLKKEAARADAVREKKLEKANELIGIDLTISSAKIKIKSAGMELKPGIYNFYKCGHVSIHGTKSINKTLKSKTFTCCPDCRNPSIEKSSFLTKFKLYKCGCGEIKETLTSASVCKKHHRPITLSDKLKGFDIHRRGSYCTGGPACQALNELHCDGCRTYIPIIKGVDPERLGYFI